MIKLSFKGNDGLFYIIKINNDGFNLYDGFKSHKELKPINTFHLLGSICYKYESGISIIINKDVIQVDVDGKNLFLYLIE